MPKRATTVSLAGMELDREGHVPLYRQLYEELRTAILSGRLTGGARLPSTRGWAEELGVARLTVLEAFEQLYADGYVEGRSGSGTFVVRELPSEVLRAPRRTAPPTTPTGRALSRRGALVTASPIPFPRHLGVPRAFMPGVAALDEFPFELWRRLLARRWHECPAELLNYGDPAGYMPLREAIAAHLAAARGVRCTPEQILIVGGSQQAIDVAARVLVDEGDPVWMEEPGYVGARGAFLTAGTRVLPVPVDEEGFDTEAAVATGQAPRLVYVTPSHQFPLGLTMSLRRRLALLDWASRRGAWVLEDDYDAEYRYAGRPLTALHGLDRDGRVIYVGTFSKVLFAGVRLGYLVVPPDLVDAFVTALALSLGHVSLLQQAVVADFMAEGHFARHIRRMRAVYAERQAALVEAASTLLKGRLEVQPTETGLHTVGWLPDGADDTALSRSAAAAGVVARAMSVFRITPGGRPGFVLGFAAPHVPEIREAVGRLVPVLQKV